MKSRYGKIISLLLAAILLSGVFSSCAAKEDGNASPASATSASHAAAAATPHGSA